MNMLVDPHFLCGDLPKFQRRSTGAVFLETMMPFDDFNVCAPRNILERPCSLFDQLHGQIDRNTHVRCVANGNKFGRARDSVHLHFGKSGRCDHNRNGFGHTML